MDSLARSNLGLLSFAPVAAETSAEAWSHSSLAPLAISSWSNTGSPRSLGNPSYTFAPLSDPGRPAFASPCRRGGAAPKSLETEGANIGDIETQSRGFGICCLRFK